MRNRSPPAAVQQDGFVCWAEAEDSSRGERQPDQGYSDDLDDLFRREASRLTRYVARRVGCREEALDLVQDAFSRFLRLRRAHPERVSRPEAYLQRVTRNLLSDYTKRRRRRGAQLHVEVDEATLSSHDQLRLLETRDMLRRLEAAMLKLKPKTREIFMAHRLDGLSYNEIAERTGLSVKGVEKQMSKAIAHLDRLLDRP